MHVLVTRTIPEVGLSLLRKHDIAVRVLSDRGVSKSALIRALRKEPYDGMITLLTDRIDAEVLDAVGSNMKIVANYAVGYNNISVEEAKKRGIAVTNTPGVLTDTVAEHTFALILSVATRVVEADDYVRANRFEGWEPELLLGLDLRDRVLGIIGAGRIGTRVAEIGKGFGMRVVYHDLQPSKSIEDRAGASLLLSPEDVLRQADVVSVHLPLTETTRHFLDARRLSLLKQTAILVNTSRGPIIDEEALITLLRDGRIFGAGLDVFEHEPNIPRALRRLPNVVLTPHTASASVATRNRMSELVAENILAVLHGGEPLHSVS